MPTTSKLPKNVKFLGIVSLLNDASSDMVYPLIPIFLTKTLGASYAMVGLIEGIAETTASLLKVFSGWLSDKLRERKPLTVLGYGLSMLAKPLLALAQAPWHVLFVRFSDRVGKGIRQAPRDALIAESTNPDILGLAYGFHKTMDTIGATIGPILAMILLPVLNENLRSLFLFSFVASFLALITLVLFVKEKKEYEKRHSLPKLSLKILPLPYKLFLVGIAVFALANFSDAFLFLRAQATGLSTYYVPVLYALSNIFLVIFATVFGKLSDRIGPYKIMVGGYIVFALTQIGFGLIASSWTVWFLFPMYGIFSAMTEGIQKTITVRIADPELKGSMLGLMHTTIGLFQLPASVMAGFLWEKVGFKTPFLLSGSLAVVAAIILVFAFFGIKRHTAPSQ